MRVYVYFNLHKNLWSVRALEGENKGRVIQHASEVYLSDCTFKVSEAGRQRVLREMQRNVHAGVTGDLADRPPRTAPSDRITYNPYKHATFVRADSLEPVHRAAGVLLRDRAAYALAPGGFPG